MNLSARSRPRAASSGASSVASAASSAVASSAASVHFSDQRLAAMAADAAAALRWDALWQQLRRPSSRWRRHRATFSASSDGAVFTREDQLSFSVLASALLPCSVEELRLVFDASTNDQFTDVMRALTRGVQSAELLYVAGATSRSSRAGSALNAAEPARWGARDAHVAVTAVKLESPGVFARSERWCFLEHLAESDGTDPSDGRWFAKTLLALPPADCLGARAGAGAGRGVRDGHDVLAGLRFEEELEGRSTRVLFSGELFYNGSDAGRSKQSASNRQVRARLLQMADWVDRIAVVVRRRRLGIQVLADRSAGRAAPNAHCVCCRRSFRLARKKSCALCGFHVCERCSAAEQRETCAAAHARSVISRVRVCDLCTVRVDRCRYTKVGPRDLAPARVLADTEVPGASSSASAAASRATTGFVLTELLQETMAGASAARKKSVLSVIKHLVEQDNQDGGGPGSARSSRAVTLTDASSAAQHFAALQTRLDDKPLPLEECVLANAETRSYPIACPAAPDCAVRFPVPASEQRRLQLLHDEQYVVVDSGGAAPTLAGVPLAMDAVPELDIICALAMKEMACSGSLITLVDAETMHVRTLSQSQYTVMKKLAATATRVVQLQARARREQQARGQLRETKKQQLLGELGLVEQPEDTQVRSEEALEPSVSLLRVGSPLWK
ncbi:hypothetical protein PybrP1_012058 [[Pythium] brassicae (nom. inval.)]|nr:hypothetical protein PybrP1_012058 [[Pythium] brassicae (nom. inval.)]